MPKIPRLSKETSLFSKGAIGSALKVLHDRIALVVTDASTSSSITVTPGFVSAVTDELDITSHDGTRTVISGGRVGANSVTADDIDATNLHVAAANITGTLAIGKLPSTVAQKSDVTNAINAIDIGGRNLFAITGSEAGYLAGPDGSIVAQAATMERTTDYIAVEPNTQYTLQAWYDSSNPTSSYEWVCLVWFDSNKANGVQAVREHLTSVNHKSWVLTSPSTAAYARVSSRWVEPGHVYARVKLENGNKPTDWTPAPEDTDADIAQVRTDAFEGIDGANASIDELSGSVQSVSDDLDETRTNLSDDIAGLRSDFETDQAAREQWLTFNGSDGMTIGEASSEFRTNYTSTDIDFMQGDEVLMNLNGTDGVNAPKVTANEVHLGGWMWVNRENGNLSLKYIG